MTEDNGRRGGTARKRPVLRQHETPSTKPDARRISNDDPSSLETLSQTRIGVAGNAGSGRELWRAVIDRRTGEHDEAVRDGTADGNAAHEGREIEAEKPASADCGRCFQGTLHSVRVKHIKD